MGKQRLHASIRRVDVQVSLFTAAVVILSCLSIFAFHYKLTYDNMIDGLSRRVESMHSYVENLLREQTFTEINTPEDMASELYLEKQQAMFNVKQATGVQYFYTAKRRSDGAFIYVVDGLDPEAPDFRRPGDPIEPEIIPELERALAGEAVMPDTIKDTEWGKIFIAYLPVHGLQGAKGDIVGVVGIEFEAEAEYFTYQALRIATPLVAIMACVVSAFFAYFFFRRISNPTYRDFANTDYLTQLKNRNAFETDLRNRSAQRSRTRTGLILMDLNNLKQVNDTLGHESGDLYLKCAAQALREAAPPKAACYRVGGDEFLVLVDIDSEAELLDCIARIKARFQAVRPQDWPVDLSFSAGFARYSPELDQDLSGTYRRADAVMYGEKQDYHGRG